MTRTPALVNALTLAGCVALLGMLGTQGFVRAQSTTFLNAAATDAPPAGLPVQSAASSFDFDVPAQPLGTALDQFAATSGRSALFPTALVAGRMSSPVRGRYTPVAALRLLLENSGVDVEEVSAGKITALVLKPANAPAVAATPRIAVDGASSYNSVVQTHVWAAICANPRTAASDYRALLRFQVDHAGHVGRVRLLASSGDGLRDAALLDVLQRLRLDQPPPPDLVQPFTMLILPDQGNGPACVQRKP